MTMTDEELDRDWKPNGRRPQSTIARSFSAELMDIFRIENSVADLDEKVDRRKQNINTQASELEALEARIREMENMLKNGGAGRRAVSASGAGAAAAAGPSSPRNARPTIDGVFDTAAAPADADRSRQPGQDAAAAAQKYGGSRPGTARASQQAVPGALPPTPIGSEDGDGEHDS